MSTELHAEDWYTIRGRGDIAVVDTRKSPFSDGHVVHVGDRVRFEGKDGDYEVTGIEQSRYLTDPPKPNPSVGLTVRKWVGKR